MHGLEQNLPQREQRPPGNELNRVELWQERRIDKERSPERNLEIEREAKRLVEDFLRKYFGDVLRVRSAISTSGSVATFQNAQSMIAATAHNIDIVASSGGQPVMYIEVNTDKNPKDSIKQMKDNPFIQLDESGQYGVPVAKVLILLSPEAVVRFMQNEDSSKNSDIEQRILGNIISSLNFVLKHAKDDAERRTVRDTLAIFLGHKEKTH